MNEEKVEVGMGATMIGYSDRRPCTIVRVISPTKIAVRMCVYERDPTWKRGTDQRWLIKGNEFLCDTEFIYTKRKNGRWVQMGESMSDGERLDVGIREKFHDYSF